MKKDVKWCKNTNELREHHRAETRGETGEEFELKEVVEPVKEPADVANAEIHDDNENSSEEVVTEEAEPLTEEEPTDKKKYTKTKKVKGDE